MSLCHSINLPGCYPIERRVLLVAMFDREKEARWRACGGEVGMSLRLSRLMLGYALLVGTALLLAGCRGSHSNRSLSLAHNPLVVPRATITIPRGQMLFT